MKRRQAKKIYRLLRQGQWRWSDETRMRAVRRMEPLVNFEWKAVTLGYDQERFQRFMNWAEAQCAIRL